jgi:hypothetical protein
MINQDLPQPSLIDTPGVDPEERGVEYWYEVEGVTMVMKARYGKDFKQQTP